MHYDGAISTPPQMLLAVAGIPNFLNVALGEHQKGCQLPTRHADDI